MLALQVYYTAFDTSFFKLPASVRTRIETKIDEIGRRLTDYPHYRLTGSTAIGSELEIIG
jgi:hypothetical protein